MIFYINSNPSSEEYKYKETQLRNWVDWYHFGEIKILTERSSSVLVELIQIYKPYQFLTYSIKEFDMSPTMICQIIFQIISEDCVFTSLNEKLYFDKNNVLEVYPKVFEIFRKDIHKSTMI